MTRIPREATQPKPGERFHKRVVLLASWAYTVWLARGWAA